MPGRHSWGTHGAHRPTMLSASGRLTFTHFCKQQNNTVRHTLPSTHTHCRESRSGWLLKDVWTRWSSAMGTSRGPVSFLSARCWAPRCSLLFMLWICNSSHMSLIFLEEQPIKIRLNASFPEIMFTSHHLVFHSSGRNNDIKLPAWSRSGSRAASLGFLRSGPASANLESIIWRFCSSRKRSDGGMKDSDGGSVVLVFICWATLWAELLGKPLMNFGNDVWGDLMLGHLYNNFFLWDSHGIETSRKTSTASQ